MICYIIQLNLNCVEFSNFDIDAFGKLNKGLLWPFLYCRTTCLTFGLGKFLVDSRIVMQFLQRIVVAAFTKYAEASSKCLCQN